VCGKRSRRVRGEFVPDPDGATLVGDSRRVVTPAGRPEADRGITGETVVRECTWAGDHNRAGTIVGIDLRVCRAGEKVQTNNAEPNHPLARRVYGYGRKHNAVLTG